MVGEARELGNKTAAVINQRTSVMAIPSLRVAWGREGVRCTKKIITTVRQSLRCGAATGGAFIIRLCSGSPLFYASARSRPMSCPRTSRGGHESIDFQEETGCRTGTLRGSIRTGGGELPKHPGVGKRTI